jgi:membrane protein implicated in regulation of membrane protease activity
MVGWQIWIIIALVLFVLELFTPGFYVMSVGLGCFLSAFASALSLGFVAQLIVLSAGSLASIFLLRPVLLRFQGDGKKSGVEALIGCEAIVVESICKAKNQGRIQVGGENWKARSTDGKDIDKGTVVLIQEIKGVTALVLIKETT